MRLTRPIVQAAIQTAAELYGVEAQELRGRSRIRPLPEARAVVWLVLRDATTASWAMLARALGKRDHTTPLTAVQRLARRVGDGDEQAQDAIEQVRAALLPRREHPGAADQAQHDQGANEGLPSAEGCACHDGSEDQRDSGVETPGRMGWAEAMQEAGE